MASSNQFELLNPDELQKATIQSRNALVFLRDFVRERSQIEHIYSNSLEHWTEKQQFILSKTGNDRVDLPDEILKIISLALTEGCETSSQHSEAANVAVRGPCHVLNSMIQSHEDVESILDDYQTTYDFHMQLVDQTKKSAKKFEKTLARHLQLRKSLQDARSKIISKLSDQEGEDMLQAIDDQLVDSDSALQHAEDKCSTYSEREQSHRDQFIEEAQRFANIIRGTKLAEMRDTLDQLLCFIRAYTEMHNCGESCKAPLRQAKIELETIDPKFAVGRWEKQITEVVETPIFKVDVSQDSRAPHPSPTTWLDTEDFDALLINHENGDQGLETDAGLDQDEALQRSPAARRRPGAAKQRPRNPHLSGPWSTLENRGQTYSDSVMERTKLRGAPLSQTRSSLCPSTLTTTTLGAEQQQQQQTASSTSVDAAERNTANLRKFNASMAGNSAVSVIADCDGSWVSTQQDRDMTREAPVKTNAWENYLSDEAPPKHQQTSFKNAYAVTYIQAMGHEEAPAAPEEESVEPSKDKRLKFRQRISNLVKKHKL